VTDIYKQVVCLFIQEGVLTLEQVREKVNVVESRTVQQSRQTPTWEAAERLCERLNAGIVANSHKPFKVNVTSVGHMEKLLRIDKVAEADAALMVDWCVGHEFWGTVIFSPIKFRKHYETMQLRRQRDSATERHPAAVSKPRVPVADQDFFEKKRRERAEAVPMPQEIKRMLGLVR